jgi:hypothetical protein
MSILDTVGLEVKVAHGHSEALSTNRSKSEEFWNPLIKRRELQLMKENSTLEIPQIPILESKLAIALPHYLRQELAKYFLLESLQSPAPLDRVRVIIPSIEARAVSLLPFIGIRVASIQYNSLGLTIEFSGAHHLLELFDSNFDLFMMFAQTYLPMAFTGAMSEIGLPGSDFSFLIAPTTRLATTFASSAITPQLAAQAPAPTPTSPVTSVALDRAKAIWQIANFTLVVPVLLALLVLYLAGKTLSAEKSDLKEWRKELIALEQANAKTAQERLTELEKVQIELITLLTNSSPATGKKE